MRLVHWILWLTPVGVFALTAWTVAGIGWRDLLQPLFFFMLTVLTGLLLHGLVVLPLFLWFFGRANPRKFAWSMRDAPLTAFGTDSSSQTLPVTIECAEGPGGCSRRATRFVLPWGRPSTWTGPLCTRRWPSSFSSEPGHPLRRRTAGHCRLDGNPGGGGSGGDPVGGAVHDGHRGPGGQRLVGPGPTARICRDRRDLGD